MFRWFALVRHKEVRVASPGDDSEPILCTSIDFFGNITLQVHLAGWKSLNSDARQRLAVQHQRSVVAMMQQMAFPSRALAWSRRGLQFGIAALASTSFDVWLTQVLHAELARLALPAAGALLWFPVGFGLRLGGRLGLRWLWNQNVS